jgi:hypothetical protein
MAGDAGLGSILGGGLGLDAGIPSSVSTSLATPMGTMAVNPLGGASLDFDAGLQNIGMGLQQSFGGAGMSGLLSLVFSLVYPSLKPMLEAAIRRVTVIVHWQEGRQERDFTLQQYITNPSRAGLLGALAEAGAGEGGGTPINRGASGSTTAPPSLGGSTGMP